mmetsp:Transcript_44486/g.128767  ORF Transcript_44486/g.128767 Transcript_44486/m.128767 type:complete len:131 (+) Transcript_44486:1171-1563(+)
MIVLGSFLQTTCYPVLQPADYWRRTYVATYGIDQAIQNRHKSGHLSFWIYGDQCSLGCIQDVWMWMDSTKPDTKQGAGANHIFPDGQSGQCLHDLHMLGYSAPSIGKALHKDLGHDLRNFVWESHRLSYY